MRTKLRALRADYRVWQRARGTTVPAVSDGKASQTVGLLRAEHRGACYTNQQVVFFNIIIGVLCSTLRYTRETGNSLN